MTTPETVKEIYERTEQMTSAINAGCREMLEETTSSVLLNVMMNAGINILSKAMAMLPNDQRGPALEDVVNSLINGMKESRAVIDTHMILRKAQGKNNG